MTDRKGSTASRFGVRAQAVACFLCVLASTLAWSVVTPPFQAPDEPLHLAYVQRLAETGRTPLPAESDRPGLSSEGSAALGVVGFSGVIGNPLAKPPWTDAEQERADAALSSGLPQDDGGGTAAYSNYPPTFYLLASVPYLAAQAAGADLIDTLAIVRLLSCLLTALTSVFVFLFVRELLPASPGSWLAAGLACGLLPYVGFIGSSVNNDNLLALASAALFFVLARSFRLGLTPSRGAAIAALVILGVASKPNFAGLMPGVALGVVLLVWQAWRRVSAFPWREVVATLGTGFGLGITYLAVTAGIWDRPLVPSAAGVGSAASSAPQRRSTSGLFSYAWQFWLPRPWFIQDQIRGGGYQLYETMFKGFIGRFGWLDFQFPEWVYTAVLVVWGALLALVARAVWLGRSAVGGRVGEFATYALMLAGLLGVIAIPGYDYRLTNGQAFEQARYLFPVLALLGGLYALAIKGAGARLGGYVAVALVTTTAALNLFGLLLTVARYYA